MRGYILFEERIKAKEIIKDLNFKEKVALFDELYTNIKNENIFFDEDIETKEWNKAVEKWSIERRKEFGK